ncbi:MAG: thermonuclease family protein [Gammaproteobacteria bacterium]
MGNGAGRRTLCVFMLAVSFCAQASEIVSYAFLNDDGSLRVRGHTIRLYGIYIPPTDDTCRTFERPVKCGPRAVLALDFKIGADFVHCKPVARNADGSIEAICRDGEDNLNEWMLMNGWAVARPEAPFEYKAMEEIARERHLGIWGIPVDVIRPRLR